MKAEGVIISSTGTHQPRDRRLGRNNLMGRFFPSTVMLLAL